MFGLLFMQHNMGMQDYN